MTISVLISTFGDIGWSTLAMERARPSATDQGAHEVITHYEREGTVTSARNAAARMATGDFLVHLDADDELAPGYVGAMERALEQNLLGGEVLLTPAVSRTRTPQKRHRGTFNPERPLSDSNWLVIGTLIRREFFWEIGGFDEADPHGLEDYSLWTRAAAAGATVIKVPDAIYVAHTRRLSSHAVYARTPEYGVEYTRIRRAAWPELYA